MSLLQPGQSAPNFSLPADNGTDFTLADYAGKLVVLFFYPNADTPGCTLESQDFTRLNKNFEKLGISVIGISANSIAQQCAFRDKYTLGVPLISDPDHIALKAYGVWGEKKNFGKPYMGIIRSTFLIDRDGTIAQTWKVARTKGHADKVLAKANELFN